MVRVATHLGEGITSYVKPDHPVQRRVTAAIEDVCGVKIAAENFATDGCSMPTMAIPLDRLAHGFARFVTGQGLAPDRSEEHTSELQSLMRISYAVFCWKKQKRACNKDTT